MNKSIFTDCDFAGLYLYPIQSLNNLVTYSTLAKLQLLQLKR